MERDRIRLIRQDARAPADTQRRVCCCAHKDSVTILMRTKIN